VGDCTNIPLAAGRLERTRPFFVAAFEAMQSIGSSTRIGQADQARRIGFLSE
jgi:hypothetical protein